MSLYQVSSIDLAAIDGVHLGTGSQQRRDWVVDPVSVSPPGNLRFTGADTSYTSMLFAIDAAVVPNWFGVIVPSGFSNPYVDFTTPNIFFHPTPGQAGYVDADYASKSGKWPQLFHYMDDLGIQLDVAGPTQIVIMPFLTSSASDTSILPANWFDIVTDILTTVRDQVGAVGSGTPLQLSQVVISSFSSGILYLNSFRRQGTGLSGYLSEVWDFDGLFSSYSHLSQILHTTGDYTVIKYDQVDATDQQTIHVPLRRWVNFPAALTSPMQVHGCIKDYLFLHACSVTSVGAA
jgi:hypothetical protein